MAWVSKENIDSKKIKLKEINKKFGVKATLSGTNTHSMKLTIQSGTIDFIENYCNTITDKKYYMNDINQVIEYARKDQHIGVNHYYLDRNFVNDALEYLQAVKDLMNEGNHDNSDPMTDYFDVGWYINIEVGRWNKPYKLEV